MKTAAMAVFQEVRRFLDRLKSRIWTPRRIGMYGFAILLAALVYGIIFSYFSILRHETFFSAAWDLGNFNQAFYTTVHNGKLFYYTAEIFFSPSGSFFAIHMSPFLLLLVPFYALSPSPETLLVLKSFGIGLAAIPLYLLAKHFLHSDKAASAVSLVYLLYAPLQGANWFDFQQSAFIPLFVFLTYFFMVNRNWRLYFPTMLLTLMIEEHVAVIIGILAFFYLSYQLRRSTFSEFIRQLKTDVSLAAIATIGVCILYTFAALFVKNSFPVNVDFADLYQASANFRILGSSDIMSLPIYALLHPTLTFQALAYEFPLKFFYVTVLFAPVLFIPSRNRLILGTIFILAPFLLSNYSPYYMLGVHYPFFIVPFVFIGVICGLLRLDNSAKIFILKTMILVTLIIVITVGPLSPMSELLTSQNYAHYSPVEFSLSQNKKCINDLIKLVPTDASILTQNLIFPHVSTRANAFVIPFSDYEQPTKMEEYLDSLLNSTEYVLLDLTSLSSLDQIVLDKISSGNHFGAYALGSDSILFKKSYDGEPINAYYTDNRTFFASSDLLSQTPPSQVIDDPTSESGKVVFYPKDTPGYCVYGPYVYLLPGIYEVTFTIKVSEHGAERLGTFDVATDLGTYIPSFRDFYGFELKTNEWTNFTISFGLSTLKRTVEFRVYSEGATEISTDRVILNRVSSKPAPNIRLTTLRLMSMKIDNGNITEDGFFAHNQGTAGEVFWYGPYWSYPLGNYNITFVLKAEPTSQELNVPVLTLSISGKTSEARQPTVLKDRVLYTQDFIGKNVSGWHIFTLNFTIQETMKDVEFRGLWPSPDYDIYLACILIQTLN